MDAPARPRRHPGRAAGDPRPGRPARHARHDARQGRPAEQAQGAAEDRRDAGQGHRRSASRRRSTRATASSRARSRASTRPSQNGTVTVDVALEGELPAGRAAGPLGGRHDRARPPEGRPLRRPPGLRPGEEPVGLFRLNEDGDEAVRVKVKLGKSSVNTVEILEGLEARRQGDPLGHERVGRVRPRALEVRVRGRGMSSQRTSGHQARRRHEGLLHRRGRDARALGRAPGDRARRVRLDRRALGLRQVDAAVAARPARLADRGQLLAERQAGRVADALGAGAHPQPRDRLHLPELQPDRRPLGLRERRAAADLPRHAVARAQEARAGGAREGRHGAPHEALPLAALGRPAAARRRRARDRRLAAHPARRRAHRQPRLGQRRGRHEPAPGPPPRGRDDLHGHARPALRQARRPHASTSSTAASSRRRRARSGRTRRRSSRRAATG